MLLEVEVNSCVEEVIGLPVKEMNIFLLYTNWFWISVFNPFFRLVWKECTTILKFYHLKKWPWFTGHGFSQLWAEWRQVQVQETYPVLVWVWAHRPCGLLQIYSRLARLGPVQCPCQFLRWSWAQATGCNCYSSAKSLKTAISIGLHRRRNQVGVWSG